MKICPACDNKNTDDAAVCHHCGGWLPEETVVQQPAAVEETVPVAEEPLPTTAVQTETVEEAIPDVTSQTEYFSVSTKKLVSLSLLSFGIYEIYWFYKNWKAIKIQEEVKLSPFWRAIFAIFFCYGLFKRILESARSRGYEGKQTPASLAVLYIAIGALNRLPDPFWLICLLTFIPIIQIQKAIDFNNKELNSEYQPSSKFSGGEIALILFGAFWMILVILGLFFPE